MSDELKRSIVVATAANCPFFYEDDRMLGPPECVLLDRPAGGKRSCVGLNNDECPLCGGVVEVRRAEDYH